VGKLAAGAVAGRRLPGRAPGQLGLHLMPAGVLGIAIATDALAIGVVDAGGLLAAVVLGTLASELLALMHAPRGALVVDDLRSTT
jgi:hypothetical protein